MSTKVVYCCAKIVNAKDWSRHKTPVQSCVRQICVLGISTLGRDSPHKKWCSRRSVRCMYKIAFCIRFHELSCSPPSLQSRMRVPPACRFTMSTSRPSQTSQNSSRWCAARSSRAAKRRNKSEKSKKKLQGHGTQDTVGAHGYCPGIGIVFHRTAKAGLLQALVLLVGL